MKDLSKINIKSEYISSSCNDRKCCLDWRDGPFALFGMGISIGCFSQESPFLIKKTLIEHKGLVNCVHWCPIDSKENVLYRLFVSGCSYGDLLTWRSELEMPYEVFPIARIEKLHPRGILVVDVVQIDEHKFMIASCGNDQFIRLTELTNSNLKRHACYSFVYSYARTLKLWRSSKNDGKLYCFAAMDSCDVAVLITNLNEDKITFGGFLKGHTGWVEGIDLFYNDVNLWLCTSSQDFSIRIWSIDEGETDCTLDSFDELSLKKTVLKDNDSGVHLTATLDSVITGHEDIVTSASWFNPSFELIDSSNNSQQPPMLISSSIDSTIIIWRYNPIERLWMDCCRVGEIGSVGVGYFGAVPSESCIIGFSFRGVFHAWNFFVDSFDGFVDVRMVPTTIASGHYGDITKVCFDPTGRYLMSSSSDCTVRLHSTCKDSKTWHEFGRPQSHGYTINTFTILDFGRIVSGSDEKIIRCFSMPKIMAENFCRQTGHNVDDYLHAATDLPDGASAPALNLSNKAIRLDGTDNSIVEGPYVETRFVPQILHSPPSEEHLAHNTLWPEDHKLYGHGFEIVALASTTIWIASSCVARRKPDAAILLKHDCVD